MSLDQIATEDLLTKLSPTARRRYLDTMLAQDFPTFVRKVFETVSPGDIFLPNMIISLAFLAPNLVKAAVEGRLPRGIGIERLRDPPPEWSRQFEALGLNPE
jgi:hypothetical protein